MKAVLQQHRKNAILIERVYAAGIHNETRLRFPYETILLFNWTFAIFIDFIENLCVGNLGEKHFFMKHITRVRL